MISATAVTLALAFWAPYNGGQPVCPGGVHVERAAYGATQAYVGRHDDGSLVPQCDMYAAPWIASLPRAEQCAWVARNIGATFFGLGASNDRRNIMYSRKWVTPGACRKR